MVVFGGGSAYKFGIFKSRNADDRVRDKSKDHDDRYAWATKYGNSAEKVFADVKSMILQIIESAQSQNFASIEQIDFSPAVKWKIAFMYSSNNILPIFKRESLAFNAKQLGFDGDVKNQGLLNEFIMSKKLKEIFLSFRQNFGENGKVTTKRTKSKKKCKMHRT